MALAVTQAFSANFCAGQERQENIVGCCSNVGSAYLPELALQDLCWWISCPGAVHGSTVQVLSLIPFFHCSHPTTAEHCGDGLEPLVGLRQGITFALSLSVAAHSQFLKTVLQSQCHMWNTGSHNACFQCLCPITFTSFYQAKERISVTLHAASTYCLYGCEWICNIWFSQMFGITLSFSIIQSVGVIKPEDKAEDRGGPLIASNSTWEWDVTPVK